jgi:uncharacterized protein YaiI (UPF0178 family)
MKTTRKEKIKQENYGKRRQRQCSMGNLQSKKLKFKGDLRTLKGLLRSCAWILFKEYFHDNTKASMGNDAKPTMFSCPSLDNYFGVNAAEGSINETVMRSACGVCSGTSSIGLNPKTYSIHSAPPEIIKLVDTATQALRDNKHWCQQMNDTSFNFCSVKDYCSYQDCNGKVIKKSANWHSDVALTSDGKPQLQNSQLPGTPVAIFTCGDPKHLWFQKAFKHNQTVPSSHCHIVQKNGSMFVLDGQDELLNNPLYTTWKHMSDMINPDDVTFSFMCRVIQKQVEVCKDTGRLHNPKLTCKKTAQHDAAQGTFKTSHYKQEKKALMHKMEQVFAKYLE